MKYLRKNVLPLSFCEMILISVEIVVVLLDIIKINIPVEYQTHLRCTTPYRGKASVGKFEVRINQRK